MEVNEYKLVDLEDLLGMSKTKIKYIIDKMGIVPTKRGRQNQVYYNSEQALLIQNNDYRNYTKHDGFIIYESKMNRL